MTTMKAIILHQYGEADALQYEEVARPTTGEGQVLIRIVAAGVNPIDAKLRAGHLSAFMPLTLPWIPGFDFSGVVEAVGAGVTDRRIGDAVFGKSSYPQGGAYAEYIAVSEADVVGKPDRVGHPEAAATPGAALTAWQGLFNADTIDLKAGQTVLILGAGGGVGSFAVQLAKWKGAHVIAAGRAPAKDPVVALGADVFVNTDRGDLSLPSQVDAVLDLVGGDLQEAAWAHLKPGGAFVSTLSQPSEEKAASLEAKVSLMFTQMDAEALEEIGQLISASALVVPIAKAYPLADAASSHEDLERHGILGKLILSV